ncbi:hypothetical protein EVAR_48878_1 [Eumeta japonica]|uniref:Uncharacterized protein n=1 Tax=Eumeta variegata TaxID=151549 RepID=A0A4C1Y6E2_EUMVA|nr:hypothetical protein EVAR_48878_1 [Eumeta japonica]
MLSGLLITNVNSVSGGATWKTPAEICTCAGTIRTRIHMRPHILNKPAYTAKNTASRRQSCAPTRSFDVESLTYFRLIFGRMLSRVLASRLRNSANPPFSYNTARCAIATQTRRKNAARRTRPARSRRRGIAELLTQFARCAGYCVRKLGVISEFRTG